MKITRIVLNDFRGFPGPDNYEFKLDGSNLLLFGENGSGKSSLFVALREFFDRGVNPSHFNQFRNVFTTDANGQPLTSGRVAVEFDDATNQLHTWDVVQNVRPHAAQPVADAALRFSFVDYRAMLKTNFVHTNGHPNLFELLVDGVLSRMPVLVPHQPQATLGILAKKMRDTKPRRHYQRRLNEVDAACLNLNQALHSYLPQIATIASQILSAFENTGITFQLIPPPLPVNPPPNPAPQNPPHIRYDRVERDFKNLKIDLVVQLHGHGPTEPQHFLNEARLSALALSIYLAAIKASIPPNPIGANIPPKVLVLDDVLIGLDMSNRQPLLDVLTRSDQPGKPGFADWQVLLLTHDQAWYNLAKRQLRNWRSVRLAAGNSGTYDVPILYDDTSHIERAERHLHTHGDERAAGVYLRVAFEEMMKSFCSRTKTLIPYHRPDEYANSTNVFWHPICGIRSGRNKRPLIDPGLKRDVEAARSNVANPLCHFGNSIPLRNETVGAISILRRLQTVLDSYPSLDYKNPQDPHSTLENAVEACTTQVDFTQWKAAVFLRAAFADSVAQLASRKHLQIRYTVDLIDFATQRLWNVLTAVQGGITLTHVQQVAGIHTHSDIFLQELNPIALNARNQAYFQAALAALLLPPPPAPPPGFQQQTWLDCVP